MSHRWIEDFAIQNTLAFDKLSILRTKYLDSFEYIKSARKKNVK